VLHKVKDWNDAYREGVNAREEADKEWAEKSSVNDNSCSEKKAHKPLTD
jgi:hypothetical protein